MSEKEIVYGIDCVVHEIYHSLFRIIVLCRPDN
jgi:hypothetical protein